MVLFQNMIRLKPIQLICIIGFTLLFSNSVSAQTKSTPKSVKTSTLILPNGTITDHKTNQKDSIKKAPQGKPNKKPSTLPNKYKRPGSTLIHPTKRIEK